MHSVITLGIGRILITTICHGMFIILSFYLGLTLTISFPSVGYICSVLTNRVRVTSGLQEFRNDQPKDVGARFQDTILNIPGEETRTIYYQQIIKHLDQIQRSQPPKANPNEG